MINNTLKVFEAFAGYGSQSIALQRQNIRHEIVGISEINPKSIIAYYALHDKNIPNFGDIKDINPQDLPEFNFFTYSFPCLDLSLSGKVAGLVKGQTRSGLLYECEKIIEYCKPKYLLLENVKSLVNTKKFRPKFEEWLTYLESLGYNSQWFVLNAKDFGIPQNRERVFCVSVLNEEINLNIRTKNSNVTLNDFLDTSDNFYIVGHVDPSITGNGAFRGRLNEEHKYIQHLELRYDGLCNTLTTVSKDNIIINNGEYRYLTGRESLRLMGLHEEEIDKLDKVITNNTEIKLAGNSIVIPVLEAIYSELFKKYKGVFDNERII